MYDAMYIMQIVLLVISTMGLMTIRRHEIKKEERRRAAIRERMMWCLRH